MKRWDFLQLLALTCKQFNSNVPDNVYRRPNIYKIKWNVPFTLCAVRGDPQWRGDPAGLGVTALTSGSGVLPGCLCGTEGSGVASSLKGRFPNLQDFGVLKSHSQQSLPLNPVLCRLMYNILCWGWVQLSVFIPRSLRGFFCQKTKQQKFHSMQNTDLCIASEIFR